MFNLRRILGWCRKNPQFTETDRRKRRMLRSRCESLMMLGKQRNMELRNRRAIESNIWLRASGC